MPALAELATMFTNKVWIKKDCTELFANWQAKLHSIISTFSGFVSLEIISPQNLVEEWSFVQRFRDPESAAAWKNSVERKELMNELKRFLIDEKNADKEVEIESAPHQGIVTEVFVTQVSPDQDKAYREWIAKIHRAEAKFPGFKGVYVQSPMQSKNRYWITFLQFDTSENLDRWMNSAERQEILKEAEPLIASLESHRVISPYAGWFASMAKKGEIPTVWKQTLIVLLVLFPIVMLEIKYLSPLTASLNLSLATFIGNAISVFLISWPLMPIAILCLGWWLSAHNLKTTLLGTLLVFVLYLIEIAIFWLA